MPAWLDYPLLAFSLAPFYLLGAIPSGWMIARMYGVRIEQEGSGNVGATNVARVVGLKAGAATLCLDVLKGMLSPAAALMLSSSSWWAAACAVATVSGHCFSIPGRLKGGKGVATGLGAVAVLCPHAAAGGLAVFAGVFSIWKIVSLASLAGAFTVPLLALLLNLSDAPTAAAAAISLLITARHIENLKRLSIGHEPKFSWKGRDRRV